MNKTYTYAVSNGTHIKVGKTWNVEQRIKSLQTASAKPLRVVAVFDGNIESAVHRDLRANFGRMKGEWFKDSAELRRRLLELGFIPPASDAGPQIEEHW